MFMWRDGLYCILIVSRLRDLIISRIVLKFVIGIKSCMIGDWDFGISVSL